MFRNLTQEAIKLAERDVIAGNLRLADKEYRKSLSNLDKLFLVTNLINLGTFYEADLVQSISL